MVRDYLQKKMVIATIGWTLITIHFLIFSQFLPNAQGKLGHDYMYNLPMLLDGYYWFLNNGLFSVPWFTPSFCGGMPLVANPATFYYSVAQFLTFLVDPLTSVRCTFFLFAALGFWGFYILLTRLFATSRETGLLGGTLFLFNGLYTYRFIIGHIEFHSFMLVPFLAWVLLRGKSGEASPRRWSIATDVVIAGLVIAYMFMSGMTQLLIPAMIGVVLIALTKAFVDPPGRVLWRFAICFALAAILALALSGFKLVAALAFLGNFQRDTYHLPGVPGIGKLILLIFRVMALGGEGVDSQGTIVNSEFLFERQELEYGLSVIPFVLLAIWMGLNLAALPEKIRGLLTPPRVYYLGMMFLLLLIPLALNYYGPAWNQFLKTIPLLKSISNFVRWIIVYIPFLIILSCLVVEQSEVLRKLRFPVLIVSIVIVIGQNLLVDKSFYSEQFYDSGPVTAGYARTKSVGVPPVIGSLFVPVDAEGKTIFFTATRNDALINGESSLLCYEPMFGYRLEFLPFKSSHPGPTLSTDGGVFNLKNPACYLYPRENQCEPGDHFRLDQRGEADNFISFQPFPSNISFGQKVANLLSLVTLLGILVFACLTFWFRVLSLVIFRVGPWDWRRKRNGSRTG